MNAPSSASNASPTLPSSSLPSSQRWRSLKALLPVLSVVEKFFGMDGVSKMVADSVTTGAQAVSSSHR